MTHEELKTKVEELEVLIKSGKDYAQAETQAQELLVDDTIANESELHCRILLALSQSLWQRGLAKDALPYAEQALTITEQIESKELQAQALGNIGNVYRLLSDYAKALECYNQALRCYEELGNKQSAAGVLSNIGIVYDYISDYPKALEYYTQALKINEETGNKSWQAINHSNIGILYGVISDLPKALQCFTCAQALYEELGNKKGMAEVNGNIGNVYFFLSDYTKALEYYAKSLMLMEELGNKRGVETCAGNLGMVYNKLSDYPKALEFYTKALVLCESLDNKSGIARHTGNIGLIYQNLFDYSKALEYYTKALEFDKELGNKKGIAIDLANIGLIYQNLLDYSKALEYYIKALVLNEELGTRGGVAKNIGDIGTVYYCLSDYPKALEYYKRALAIEEELGVKISIAINTGNIGLVYANEKYESYDAEKATEYLLQAISMLEEIGAKKEEYEFLKSLAELYEKQERWKDFAVHYKRYHELEKEVQSEESKKQAERLDYERKTAEREKRIAVERAESQARIEEQEKLLHNVLPPTIAERLLKKETFIADSYPSVSVLFMDLVGFTRIASIVPPKHLIYLLNSIFSAADNIMEQYGLEKIKTIGDAYMAVAGAPESQEDHAIRAASASIALLDRMNTLHINIPSELGDISWIESIGEIGVRIGIHSGEAIGGVIGDKKFSFDLWGDAVNTASRMESHGEAGKIHISEEFKHAVETVHAPSLRFIPRGDMEIKGKGMMKTYFLEKVSEP